MKVPAVFAYAEPQDAILPPGDKDFSKVLAYPPPHAGITVVEIPDTLEPEARKRAIVRELTTPSGQSLDSTLAVIEPGRVSVRRRQP